MATAAAAPGLVAALRSQLAALHDGFGPGPITYLVAPLAVRTTPEDAGHVAVDVWYVAVAATPARAAYATWRVMRYQLAWERGAWHEAAEHDDTGPQPAEVSSAAPLTATEWAAQLDGFAPVGVTGG
jgi:hypothetical protein